jgi:uncharacterized protein
MTSATAHVPTTDAAKYIQDLCKHWSHRLRVELEEGAGTVRFPDAVASMTAKASELVINVEADDAAMLDLIKGVVARHLDRFAFREAPLSFEWSET